MSPRIEAAGSVRCALGLTAAFLLLAGCSTRASQLPTPSPDQAPSGRRAILASFDSFSERRMLESLPADRTPAIRRLFSAGACAAFARAAFPSLTAPGHASLWTGAYGDVSGIAGNDQPRLPQHEHTLLERISGFSYAALRAEPIWVTAGRAGIPVVGHHVTQAPFAPGYPAILSPPDDSLLVLRRTAARALAAPHVAVLNGYNRQLAGDTILTHREAPPRPARGWRAFDALRSSVPPLEISWTTGADSLFGLLHGTDRYDRLLVSRTRDAASGAIVRAAPPDTAPVRGRPLARFFSDPIALSASGGAARLVVRLFDVAPDGSTFELFMPEVHVIEANRPEVAVAYAQATGGWVGNAPTGLLRRGALGTPLAGGGDGAAEARWLDAAEYQTRQTMRGSEWAWRTRGAALLLDYFSLGDETDHLMYGIVSSEGPAHDPALVAAVSRVRTRAWELVDLRLGALQQLVAGDADAILVVSGDHGMRTTWRTFRPNVALADAGLLERDGTGRPVLARTQALTTNGNFININDDHHLGGIVRQDSVAAVAARVIAALLAVRGDDAEPVVTAAWTAAELDSLGAGGPAGGDVYYELASGYRFSWDSRGAVTSPATLDAGHGFLPTSPDMHTVLCAMSDGIAPRRIGPARTIDAAPTVAEWIGIPAPRNARGRSLVAELLGR
jgi:predicted AlkP superfamily phosphohydrolase/phosphomutase